MALLPSASAGARASPPLSKMSHKGGITHMAKDTRAPQEILAHIIAARIALTSAIYGLSEDELTREGPVGRWSVKDVMAHIGHWEEVCLEEFETHLRGERTGKNYRDVLALND